MFTDWPAVLSIPVLVIRGSSSQSYVDIVRARTARDPRPAVLQKVPMQPESNVVNRRGPPHPGAPTLKELTKP
jgi:hypothetical protein